MNSVRLLRLLSLTAFLGLTVLSASDVKAVLVGFDFTGETDGNSFRNGDLGIAAGAKVNGSFVLDLSAPAFEETLAAGMESRSFRLDSVNIMVEGHPEFSFSQSFEQAFDQRHQFVYLGTDASGTEGSLHASTFSSVPGFYYLFLSTSELQPQMPATLDSLVNELLNGTFKFDTGVVADTYASDPDVLQFTYFSIDGITPQQRAGSPTPEPATALFGIAVLGVVGVTRYRRQRAVA